MSASQHREIEQSAVRGVFRDKDAVVRAVEGLAEKSVPADMIRVFVLDGQGKPAKEVEVDDESGVLRGAMIGGIVGASIGLAIVVLALLGGFGEPAEDVLGLRTFAGALRAMAALAAATIPLGALIGLGRWQGRKKLAGVDVGRAGVLVVVDSDELTELAIQVLEEAGAEAIRRG